MDAQTGAMMKRVLPFPFGPAKPPLPVKAARRGTERPSRTEKNIGAFHELPMDGKYPGPAYCKRRIQVFMKRPKDGKLVYGPFFFKGTADIGGRDGEPPSRAGCRRKPANSLLRTDDGGYR